MVIFDSGHPDVLVVLQQQIKGTLNTPTSIKDNWLHVSTLIESSSGFVMQCFNDLIQLEGLIMVL
jgi:hypothetical protein